MPIDNIMQTISTIPPAGRRGVDVQTVFVTKQEDFQDHLQGTTVTELNTLKDQLNTRIDEINSTTTTMNGYATSASSSVTTATTKAEEASTSASAALTSKNQASTFASDSSYWETRASKWADNNYNVAVETGRYSAKHWSVVAQNATANKVDKVTSTDNAIVRFDGITGAVQNSGVIIDDAGNVGVGEPTPTSKFHVRGNIRTACSGDDAVNTRGIIFDIGGDIHGRLAVDNTDNLLFFGSGFGYGMGSGGVVTQLTGKNYIVSLNKPTGTIITSNSVLLAGQRTWFVFLNSLLDPNDTLTLTPRGTIDYDIDVIDIYKGAAAIRIINRDSISHSDAISISFTIIKGANS